MKAQWDLTTPIKGLFEQINNGLSYATAGDDVFTNTQLVRFGYNNINSNGRMSPACRDWRGRLKIERTWPNLKNDLKAAHIDLRLCTTAGASGFHGQANHAAHTDPDETDDNAMQAYLTNLAEAALATNATTTSLTATVAHLKTQVTIATNALTVLQAALNPTSGNTQRPLANNGQPRSKNYCWTHGVRVGKTHTSAGCQNKSQGHKDTETFNNRMDGTGSAPT